MLLRFDTQCGSFDIGLDLEAAPRTAGYFRDLANLGALDDSRFFRIVSKDNASLRADVPIEVVQGGLRDSDAQPISPIAHEPTSLTGLFHKKWTVSTARFAPGETYGSFFICLRDEPALDYGGARHPDGHGFAAFGSVVTGKQTIHTIFAGREPTEEQHRPVIIHSARCLAAS